MMYANAFSFIVYVNLIIVIKMQFVYQSGTDPSLADRS